MKMCFLFLFCVVCITTPAAQIKAGSLASPSLFKVMQSEPGFSEIVEAAYQSRGVSAVQIADWEKKIKRSGLLPKFYLGYDYQNRSDESFSITDNISVTSSGITVGPEDNDWDYGQNYAHVVRARAVWDLDKLIFNRELLNFSKHRSDLVRTRRVLTDQIYQVYEKRYLFLELYFKFRRTSRSRAKSYYLKYLLLTERLNEITDGKFKNKFWRQS